MCLYSVASSYVYVFVSMQFFVRQGSQPKTLTVTVLLRSPLPLLLKCISSLAYHFSLGEGTGLSDPYCRLGILNEKHQEKSVVKHKDLEEWQRERLVESLAATTVKPATLEPEWNEDVYL